MATVPKIQILSQITSTLKYIYRLSHQLSFMENNILKIYKETAASKTGTCISSKMFLNQQVWINLKWINRTIPVNNNFVTV